MTQIDVTNLGGGTAAATGPVPDGSQTSTTVVTSATTTFVTVLTCMVTITATAKILAVATMDIKATTAACIAQARITINGVAGQFQSLSLLNTTDHYTSAIEAISTSLAPGTYLVNVQINRLSGTGTVNFFQGTLIAEGLQGANTQGITSITGLGLSVGPGSGAQALTGLLTVAGGGTHLSSTTINQILYSSSNNVIAGLATANTGALVTSSTGVPSITSGSTANRLLRTNGTTVSFAQAALTTDVSGILPGANGGTGVTMFAAGRIPFSNGTTHAADALFTFTTANTRFFVGQGGGTGRINGTVLSTDPSPNDPAGNFFSRATANSCVNIQNENTLATIDMTNSGGTTIGANIFAEASRGTLGSRTQSQSGDVLFSVQAHGFGAAAYSTGLGAAMGVVTSEVVTNAANGAEWFFSTTPNGAATPVERFRIKQNGNAAFTADVAAATVTPANGASGTFTTVDLKTVTVTNGIITSIV